MNLPAVDPVVELIDRARASGLDPELLAPIFERFVTIARRHAALERAVLGSVPLSFPAHLLEGSAAVTDPLAGGASLASRERERLGGDPAVLDRLERILEDQGVKVVSLTFPAGSSLLSAFVFHSDTGPAILVDAANFRRERDYALAHAYGHYLADHDPWHAWTCRTGGGGDSIEELRAHGFAGALLVPEAALTDYLAAVPPALKRPVSADLVRQLRVYFEADDRAILGRLLALGHITTSEIAPLMAGLAPVEGDPSADTEGSGAGGMFRGEGHDIAEGLSDRYVTLAVMAHRAGQLDTAGLARALETDESTALAIDGRFRREETGEEEDGQRTH
ncbi:MAG TPA: ImmA/IrrE family metallo-endopeptidase [Candidatus Eisenbacteria bacterium]